MNIKVIYPHETAIESQATKFGKDDRPDRVEQAQKIRKLYKQICRIIPKWCDTKTKRCLKAINIYRHSIRKIQADFGISTQGPFYASFIEELPTHLSLKLIRELIEHHQLALNFVVGHAQCLICVNSTADGRIYYQTKNMDWALAFQAKDFNDCLLAMIGIEGKRYADSNMHHTIVHTKEYLQRLRPPTIYIALAENEGRGQSLKEISVTYDCEFILTKFNRIKPDMQIQDFDLDEFVRFKTYLYAAIKESIELLDKVVKTNLTKIKKK